MYEAKNISLNSSVGRYFATNFIRGNNPLLLKKGDTVT